METTIIDFGFTWFYRAAHKAARAAGESPVKGETNALVVITDLCLERSGTGKPQHQANGAAS